MRVAVASVLLTLGIGIRSEAQDTTRSRWRDQPLTGSAAVALDVTSIPGGHPEIHHGQRVLRAVRYPALADSGSRQALRATTILVHSTELRPCGELLSTRAFRLRALRRRVPDGGWSSQTRATRQSESRAVGSSFSRRKPPCVGTRLPAVQHRVTRGDVRRRCGARAISVRPRSGAPNDLAWLRHIRRQLFSGLQHPTRAPGDGRRAGARFLTQWLQVGGTGQYQRFFEPVGSYHSLDAFARVYLPLSTRVLPFADGFVGEQSSGVPGARPRGSHDAASQFGRTVRRVALDASMEWRTYGPVGNSSSILVRQSRHPEHSVWPNAVAADFVDHALGCASFVARGLWHIHSLGGNWPKLLRVIP